MKIAISIKKPKSIFLNSRRTLEIIKEQKMQNEAIEKPISSDKDKGIDGPMSDSMISTDKASSSEEIFAMTR